MNSNEIDIHKELKYFGFSQFKGLQEQVIQSLLNRHNTFVIMPTGGGALLSASSLIQEGTAIVVSPLIALMKNQVDAIRVYLQREVLPCFKFITTKKRRLPKLKKTSLRTN
jgi:ATP-dependent DNA helicase RecQ